MTMRDELRAVPSRKKLTAALLLLSTLAAFAALLAAGIFFGAYQRQLVRVEKVERLCVMKPQRNRGLGFYNRPVVTGSCEKLALAYKKEWRWRSNDYHQPEPHIFVSFIYHSPADGAEHVGRLMRVLNDVGRPADVGNQIRVYVSRWIADVYTDFWNPNWPLEPKNEATRESTKQPYDTYLISRYTFSDN